MKEVHRHVDTWESLSSFQDVVLVVCPKCGACASQIRTKELDANRTAYVRNLTCRACGLARKGGTLILPGANLPGTYPSKPPELDLWLQTPCCGQTLWAFNLRHIETIESYVRAELREQHKVDDHWSNTSLVNRLPQWMKAANNREDILKGIARLKAKLPN